MANYKKVTKDLVDQFGAICGAEFVIFDDNKKLTRYSGDQVADKRYRKLPEVAILPSSAEQISAILKLANREQIPVTPRGAGSGLSGGAVPLLGGICLSLERMNRILEIDLDNLTATLEPGVVTSKLDAVLADTGLFFAGYPLSEEFCFIGGNVAENAGGGRAVKYGVTGRYVIGLEVILPDGSLVCYGGKITKDVTGYDMIGLFVGSEGTLGIFTKIVLRLLPRPRYRFALRAIFGDATAALSSVPLLLRDPDTSPSAIEFIDSLSLRETQARTGLKILADAQTRNVCVILAETDGNDSVVVEKQLLRIRELLFAHGAIGITEAREKNELDELWQIRKQIPWALKQLNPNLTAEDIIVPVKEMANLLSLINRLENTYNLLMPCFGHAADANFHVSPMRNPTWSEPEWDRILASVLKELYSGVRELGGTISGEHGIGHKRKKYLPLVMGTREIDILRGIKKSLDPRGILNPGKIFD